jgi:integrase
MARPPTGQVLERPGKDGITYALRFRAYGKRRYETLDVTSRSEAEQQLRYRLDDVERGIWKPPSPPAVVEVPPVEPTFHELASEWVASRTYEVDARTVEHWTWALSGHLLPFFAPFKSSQITVALVEQFKTAKLREREAATKARAADPKARVSPGLSNRSINSTLRVLGQVLDHAVELGYMDTNPARGRKRRLKAGKPRRTWLEVDELRALLDAAGDHRALLSTMALGGLRVTEACQLRWRDVGLANGKLTVADSKTAAGVRQVDLTPMLLDELKAAKAAARRSGPDDLVFPTRVGTMRDRNNVRTRVLASAIERANANLARAGRPPLQDGVTNHTLRRTFCALLYEAGASPAYAMQQMGHASASLALEIYSKVMTLKRDTGARMDALLQAADWAQTGTNGMEAEQPLASLATAKAV